MGAYNPLVSIIVPAYNEEADIGRTLDALVRLEYKNEETIVVDDGSTDNTAQIVDGYVCRHGVRLIRQENRGVGAARNRGIKESKGDILVILNADVFPEEDFLNRILPHYERGADCVAVESRVANQERLFPRFIEAQHHCEYDGQDWIIWTEGFSCRKEAALSAGLFPETPPPGFCGEDAIFGVNLVKSGFRKIIDKSIVVPHVAPASLVDFWRQRKGVRGLGVTYRKFYVERMPLRRLVARTAVKTALYWGKVFCIVPVLTDCIKLARFSKKRWRDLFPFMGAYALGLLAHMVGEWSGLWRIYKRLRSEEKRA